MLFLPLPKLPEKYKKRLYDIYLKSSDSELYEDKRCSRVTNIFIKSKEHQDWIYSNLIYPLGISRNHIKNLYHYKNHKCCGMNFSVFRRGDWCHPHQDLNPTKIHLFWLGDCKKHTLFFSDQNTHWDYSSPVMINVSQKHTVTQLDQLTSKRVMFQIFLTETIEYYRELLNETLKKGFSWKS